MKPKRRKYDTKEHRSARKRLGREVASGRASCWRCGKPIGPGTLWHVGHDDAGVAIMGAEHAKCNLSAQNRLRAARARAFTNGGSVELAATAAAAADTAPRRPSTSRWPAGFSIDESGCPVVPDWVDNGSDIPHVVLEEFAAFAEREMKRGPRRVSRDW